MNDYKVTGIVPVEDIPKAEDIQDVFADDPMGVYRICREMEILCDKENGIGLSAVQVGIPWKLFIVKIDGQYGYYADCDYEPITEEEQIVSVEGCLSVRSEEGQLRHFYVKRHPTIEIKGFRLVNNNDNRLKFEEFDQKLDSVEQSVVFQHEIDHQKGILISDCGKEIFIWQ